jgi:iron complex outermembrane receptor protein/vitamin B12 transporter
VLDYAQAYPYQYQLVSNRDQLMYQGDYRVTPHLMVLAGFHFEDERGSEVVPSYSTNEATERTNYDYIASVHGDFKHRFFYTLGGSLEHYSLFGVDTTPRAGLSMYALRPRNGILPISLARSISCSPQMVISRRPSSYTSERWRLLRPACMRAAWSRRS